MAVVLSVYLGKTRGGIEIVMIDYAKALSSLGYESYLLSSKGRDYIDYLRNSGLKLNLLFSRSINPFTILQFIFFLRRLKPEVVFLHGTRAILIGSKWYIRKLFPKIKFVGVSHGVTDKRYSKLEYVIAITKFLANSFKDLGIPHIYFCPNKTRILPFEEQRNRRDPIVIGSIGRLSSSKGFDVLINALKVLKQRGFSFKLRLAGFSLEDLEKGIDISDISDEIEVLGWISDKESFYKSIDIYVSASRVEPFGLTIIEAISHSIAVIATETQGGKEIISSGENGVLVSLEDYQGLSEAIYDLSRLEDKDFNFLRFNGYKKEKTEYNLENLPKDLNHIILNILSMKA